MRHDGAQGLAQEMVRLLVSVFMAVASAHGGAPARRLRSKVSPAVASSASPTTAAPIITDADKAKFVEAALGEEILSGPERHRSLVECTPAAAGRAGPRGG